MTDTTATAHDWDGCLICAVRALTEGKPREWTYRTVDEMTDEPEVTGVILRMGHVPSQFSTQPVPFVDLWIGGVERVRITQYGSSLANAIKATEPQIGDTLTVRFEGEREVESGKFKGLAYKAYSATIQRGHH
jgi:hypothetical protein